MALIELKNVCKEFELGDEKIRAVQNVNLKINSGEFLSMLGPSGSGKSTLLHLIGALDKPDRGKIVVDRRDISEMKDLEAARFRNQTIGFVFQTFNLLQNLTSLENVIFPLSLDGISSRKASKLGTTALEAVGLGERVDHKPAELSGGELQRVAIARAIATRPKILLADEPTGNLDSKTGSSIMKLLQNLNQKGQTIIVVTHNRRHARYAKRTIELLDGKIKSDDKKR